MSNRVNGARLKAASLIHSKKQLLALGCQLQPAAGAVSFEGKTAFASWNALGNNTIRSYNINYPALADNALLSRREADLIAAYTLHEIGHIAFTNNESTRHMSRLRFAVWNGIEDARIEHAVIASGKAQGARSSFKRLLSRFTINVDREGFNPTSINSAPFALALICRAAYGDGNGYAKRLLDRIPEPKRSIYAKVADAMSGLSLDRSGTEETLLLADLFLKEWGEVDPESLAQPAPPVPPEFDDSDDESDDESQDSDDGLFDSDEDDEQQEQQEQSGSGQSDDSDDDDESGDDADDDLLQALQQAAENGVEDQVDTSAFNVTEDDDADDGDASGGEGTGFGGAGELEFNDVDDVLDEARLADPEPNIDDVFDAVSKRTKDAVTLPVAPPSTRSLIRNWTKMADDEKAQRRNFRAFERSSLPALRAQLYRVLKAPEMQGWDSGALGGRFDGKRTSRLLAGSESVFKRRWLAEGINTAVSVVVDLSGSMNGERIKTAVDLAWTIASAAEQARADVEVVGFTTKHAGYQYGAHNMAGEYFANYGSAYDAANLLIAKRFQDRMSTCATYFRAMKRLASGGTPDYAALRSVAEALSTKSAQRKLVIVITDGFGYGDSVKRLTEASYSLYGVDIVGFGIGVRSESFANAYSVGAAIGWNLDNLHKTALKSVAKQLEARDLRRVA